jgi:hypothetical protein
MTQLHIDAAHAPGRLLRERIAHIYEGWAAWCLRHRAGDAVRHGRLLLWFLRAGAAAADRLPAGRRPLADAGARDPAARRDTRRDGRRSRPGVLQTTIGDAESMAELFESFGLAMATGVLCIYLVLVLLFKDFVQPVTILAALVLSVPGAFLALFVTGQAISMSSMIGLIMLMGIATKNSILLVDYVILARREHGLDRWNALLDACRKRARPIVMTTIAMGAGMLPIAIGIGTDPSFRAPMAIVVIGGLITSTFLSLLVIPVVFTFVDDAIVWIHQHLPKPRA